MNKKIAMSLMSITAALVVMGGATYAAFSGSATATNNTFAAGNANLEIAVDNNGPVAFGPTIAGPNFTGILPGQTKTFDFWLKNTSSDTLTLDLVADVSALNPDPDADQAIDNVLLISWNCDTDFDNSLGNNTPSAAFSPRDWLVGGNASVGSLPSGEDMFCRMIGTLPLSADNTVAGETVAFDVKYDATQAVAP